MTTSSIHKSTLALAMAVLAILAFVQAAPISVPAVGSVGVSSSEHAKRTLPIVGGIFQGVQNVGGSGHAKRLLLDLAGILPGQRNRGATGRTKRLLPDVTGVMGDLVDGVEH
ncbi:hypothetical protein BGX29_004539 [Mortierella sp. GBA35]|nr:hypothetical protein BGX23_006990 [Mortierella sp. AD031]KAF9102490.1 hypothetical protein BGX29_004539 [Mortierella sp. GBA35]KAG0204735.1 hypothetical protein BGX33_008308 [Mortierella sp. NVP41]